MKKAYISVIGVVIAFFIFASVNVFASSNDYEIINYKVDIDVNENNTYNITEYITVNFNEPKHGIYREIPLSNDVERLDGSKTKIRATISDVSVEGAQYKESLEMGNKILKIGDPDETVTGVHDYKISYLYDIGNDSVKDYDEFYFNIIGTSWDTTVSGIEFTINMPKEFDQSKLGFSSGEYGEQQNENITYTVDDNTINGTYNGTLNPGEALTVRLQLPEGYFVKQKTHISIEYILTMAISGIFVLISYFMWRKYGKDEKVVPIIQFYPPEGYNSAEIAFMYNGSVDSSDIVSLLIYLADKGYISIEELQGKKYSKEKDYRIVKVKEYDGDNETERDFMKGLFISKTGKPINEVKKDDLYDRFYIVVNRNVSYMNSSENKEKIFLKNSLNKTVFLNAMLIIIYGLISYRVINDYYSLMFIITIGALMVATIKVLFSKDSGTIYINGVAKKSKSAKYFVALTTFVIIGFVMTALVLPNLLADFMYLITYVVGLVAIIIIAITSNFISKRNEYGYEILCKIEGFKNFLETAEKDKLEELVMEDPSYFYNILPYTYVLGISDTWIEKFESIAIEAPTWYVGHGRFTMHTFNGFMGSTISNSTAKASSKSSGGGFSGGGVGGGGGGSW